MKNHKLILTLLCAVTFFVSSNVSAQNNDESLFWEISGNGLTSPSYLYGTIHVQDKRVFNLPDSVIIAIENCDAFAGELNMDSVYGQLMEYFATNSYFGKTIEELLTDEEYQQLDKKSQQVLGMPLNQIPIRDPRIIAFAFEGEQLQKDIPFALDEYLYRIAKSNKKTITSVEKIEDQLNVFNALDEETIKELLLKIIDEDSSDVEKLVLAYSNNDLETINELMTSWEKEFPELADVMLYNRNINMAEEIKNLINNYPVFVAIGAGHLAGQRGVIALLKKSGFKLRPIVSISTDLSGNYPVESMALQWQTYSPSTGEFEIEMPGMFFPIPMMSEMQGNKIESAMCLDESGTMLYLVIKLESENYIEGKSDSLVQNILNEMTEIDSLIINPITSYDGLKGNEFIINFNGVDAKVNVYSEANRLYMFLVSMSDDEVGKKNAERFLRSFRLKKS